LPVTTPNKKKEKGVPVKSGTKSESERDGKTGSGRLSIWQERRWVWLSECRAKKTGSYTSWGSWVKKLWNRTQKAKKEPGDQRRT